MTIPHVSVVVPAYNAASTIGACVAALQEQSFDLPYEIIVVNDGSTDRTAAVAEAAGATVLTTPNGRPAAARNAGIHAARGSIVCCTDADCVPHPDWLREITAPFANPEVVASKGTYATRQQELVARFVQLEYEDKYDRMRPGEAIDFVDTYSAAYRRDVLLAHDGFDERFDYLEDQELSFRLAAHGYKMVFQPTAIVDHLHSATLGDYLRKKRTIGYWKALVVSRYPDRAIRDSHTPQIMKVQMLLSLLLVVSTLLGTAGLIIGPGRWELSAALFLVPAATVGLLFLATTLPFIGKAWPKDRAVAIVSPVLLLGRALALGVGYALGALRPIRRRSGQTTNIA
ncbi:MAG: glycosyltransferase [Candidatus Promineofilum sp.]|nr:glycosyltransferase [Promineifilum sp.]